MSQLPKKPDVKQNATEGPDGKTGCTGRQKTDRQTDRQTVKDKA